MKALIAKASQAGAGIIIRGGAAKGGPGKEQGDLWEAWQRVGIDDLLGEMSRMEFIVRFTYIESRTWTRPSSARSAPSTCTTTFSASARPDRCPPTCTTRPSAA